MGAPGEGLAAFVRLIRQTYSRVSAARISWLVVIGACAIAVVLLAFNGYTGYSITVAAVGAAAAVNLL